MGLMRMGAPEVKFQGAAAGFTVKDGAVIEGYASVFGREDQSGDVVARGAYAAGLKAMAAAGRRVKMLWQHDPAEPIGVWDEVREDDRGLWVKGRILAEVARGREALALVGAGAIDGLSIGYRTVRASRDGQGRRVLSELDLWEVSLVTFPMLPEARVAAKGDGPAVETGAESGAESGAETWRRLAEVIEEARRRLAQG